MHVSRGGAQVGLAESVHHRLRILPGVTDIPPTVYFNVPDGCRLVDAEHAVVVHR
jgi:hypothetical protein